MLIDKYVLCMSVALRCQQVVHGGSDDACLIQLGLHGTCLICDDEVYTRVVCAVPMAFSLAAFPITPAAGP